MAINLSQQRFLQPLRSNILGSKELAIEALQNVAAEIAKTDSISTKADGSQIVARYTDGDIVKSIFGIYEHSKKAITIYSYDDEALEKEIDALENAIEAAESAAKAAATKVVLAEDDETKAHLGIAEAEGADGDITYTLSAKDIASQTDLNSAVSRIEANESAIETLNGDESVKGSVAKEVKDGVDALRTELLGEVSDTDAKTFAELNDKIESVESAAKSYSIVSVTGDELSALGTNVKEAWKLIDEENAKSGEIIKIYKDSSLKSVELSGQVLNFTYILSDGSEEIVPVDVSTFLAESEFKNGLQVNDGVVSVKLAEGSEGFLTVGEDGVKLSGVQDAINKAKNDAIQAIDDADYLKNIKVNGVEGTVVEGSNIAEVTIDGDDVALSSEYVKAEYTDVTAAGLTPVADGSIEDAISTLEGNIVKLTKEVLDNETVCANAITKLNEELGFNENAEFVPCDGSKYISGAASISEALCILDSSLKSVSDAASGDLSAAVADLDATVTSNNGQLVNITVVEVDGKLTSASVDETALSSKIAEIEKEIDDNKAASDADAAAAKTEVVGGTTNNMLTVTPSAEGANADGHTTYTVDLSDTWDCGTFEYTQEG